MNGFDKEDWAATAKELLIEALTEEGFDDPATVIDYLAAEIQAASFNRLSVDDVILGLAICVSEVIKAVSSSDVEDATDLMFACPRLAKGLGFELES